MFAYLHLTIFNLEGFNVFVLIKKGINIVVFYFRRVLYFFTLQII